MHEQYKLEMQDAERDFYADDEKPDNCQDDGVVLSGGVDARCDVTLTYKGKTLKGYWQSESGYNLYNDDETEAVIDAMSVNEEQQFWDWLMDLPQPSLTLENKDER